MPPNQHEANFNAIVPIRINCDAQNLTPDLAGTVSRLHSKESVILRAMKETNKTRHINCRLAPLVVSVCAHSLAQEMKSASAQLLDDVIASGAKPFLRDQGFRKRAHSFHKKDGELYSVINFQSSQWNSDGSCKFTVNLNKILPFYHEKWTGQTFPENPTSAAPVCSYRIGLLMPENKDLWWEAHPESDVAKIAADVVTKLGDYGLPFLSQASDLGWIAEQMLADKYFPGSAANQTLTGAIILAYQGKTHEASDVIDRLRRENKVDGFGDTISTIERRLKTKC